MFLEAASQYGKYKNRVQEDGVSSYIHSFAKHGNGEAKNVWMVHGNPDSLQVGSHKPNMPERFERTANAGGRHVGQGHTVKIHT